MGKLNWVKALSIAGGAVTVAAISYLLLRDDDSSRSKTEEESKDKNKSGNKQKKDETKIDKENLLQLLNEMHKLQVDTKNMIKDLTEVAKKNNYDIMSVYNAALSYETEDPLTKYQMQMPEFDEVVENYQHDPEVKEALKKLMNPPEAYYPPMSSGNVLSVQKIIEIHNYMLKELKLVQPELEKIPNKNELEPKILALVIQSIISGKVEEKFNITSQEVEMSIGKQQYNLTVDVDFAKINMQMQSIMNKMMGLYT